MIKLFIILTKYQYVYIIAIFTFSIYFKYIIYMLCLMYISHILFHIFFEIVNIALSLCNVDSEKNRKSNKMKIK